MTMKRLKRIFTGTLPLFLLLWAGMMALLAGLNWESYRFRLEKALEDSRQRAESNYERTYSDGQSDPQKSVALTRLLDSRIYSKNDFHVYDGFIQFQFYSADRQELARTPIACGSATPLEPDDNPDTWYIWLDPVLSQDEQLSFAHLLLENPLTTYCGDAFLYDQSQTPQDAFCQIVGVADQERHVLYPKTITYIYPDQENCILDSNSSFFDGKELTTMEFGSIKFSSALAQSGLSPENTLNQWQRVEQRMELLFSGTDDLPSTYSSASDCFTSYCYPLSDGTTLVYGYFYNPISLVTEGLGSTALFTLLAVIAMALYTDHRQRRAIQRERDFARAAAHELKTPLAVLRAHAEALREDIAPEKRDQYLDVVLSESDRMSALVGSLLELARTEAKGAAKKEPVDLAALVREVFAPLALPLEQKHLQLQLELEEVSLSGDRARLEEAVENLASNALRHADSGGTVQVSLEKLGHRARLTVYNDGPNIPSEDLSRLWEPFYRADPSRNRDSGGTGLGLAIVWKTVEAHGGRCWTENRPGGVAFVLELPI